jgi:hypothetical protein
MSLYNAINGRYPKSTEILALLDLTEEEIERYRDCRVFPKTRTIEILARTGGGNREDYPNTALTAHPGYVSDRDANFDGTYAVYTLKVPDATPEVTLRSMNEGIRWKEG